MLPCKELAPIKRVNLRLQWHHIDTTGPNANPALVQTVQNQLAELAGLPNLDEVALEVTSSTPARVHVQSAAAVTALLNRFPHKVVSLRLSRGLLFNGVRSLIRALRVQFRLEALCLDRVSAMPDLAHCWAPLLLSAVSSLPKLTHFQCSSLIPVQMHIDAMVTPLANLATCEALTSLDLRDFIHCYGGHGEMVIPMMQALGTSRLQHLDLSGTNPMDLQESFFRHVGAMLLANTSLERITLPLPLSFQGAQQQGIILPLIQSLEKNRSLKYLHLCAKSKHCPVVQLDISVQTAICDVLEHDNFSLEYLQFTPAQFDLSSLGFRFYLKLNSIEDCRRLRDPRQASSATDWLRTIWGRSHDLDVVYYFLRRNPVLVKHFRGDAVGAMSQEKARKVTCKNAGRFPRKRRRITRLPLTLSPAQRVFHRRSHAQVSPDAVGPTGMHDGPESMPNSTAGLNGRERM